MKQNRSRETNSRSSSQEMFHFYGNRTLVTAFTSSQRCSVQDLYHYVKKKSILVVPVQNLYQL